MRVSDTVLSTNATVSWVMMKLLFIDPLYLHKLRLCKALKVVCRLGAQWLKIVSVCRPYWLIAWASWALGRLNCSGTILLHVDFNIAWYQPPIAASNMMSMKSEPKFNVFLTLTVLFTCRLTSFAAGECCCKVKKIRLNWKKWYTVNPWIEAPGFY